MAVQRPDYDAMARGGSVDFCLLIAGYPHPIAMRAFDTVTWTADADAAWHAGISSITPKLWLGVGGANGAPIALSERAAVGARESLDIGELVAYLHDPGLPSAGEMTLALFNRRSMPSTYLTASLQAADTTASVESTADLEASGTVHIGREAITYSGKTSTTLTGLGRGAHGTRAKLHPVTDDGMVRPVVYQNPVGLDALPSLRGRRCTLWLLRRASASSTTVLDPALLFDGRIGDGNELAGPGRRIAAQHVARALDTKLRQVRVTLAGYNHHGQPSSEWGSSTRTPESDGELLAVWVDRQTSAFGNAIISLTSEDPGTGGGVVDGWCATAEELFVRWNNKAAAVVAGGYTVTASVDGSGRLFVWVANSSSSIETHVRLCAAWLPGGTLDYPDADSTSTRDAPFPVRPDAPFPAAWVPLSKPIHLSAFDAGQLPSPTVGSGGGVDGGSYQFGLQVKIGERSRRVLLSSVSGSVATGTLVDPSPALLDGIVTQPTDAVLTLDAVGDTWWGALRYGVLAGLDGWQGLDHFDDSIAWDDLIATARRVGGPLPTARRYHLDTEDSSFLTLLRNECTLAGLTLCTRGGRLSVTRIEEVAATEPTTATITRSDLVRGQAAPQLVETPAGTLTSFKLTLPDKSSVRVVDVVAEDEAGRGSERAASAVGILRDDVVAPAIVGAVMRQAMAVIGPFSHEYRVVTVAVDLRYAGVELGDLVLLSAWLLPDGAGARGLTEVPCQVLGRRVRFYGDGKGGVELDLLLSEAPLAGYAPELLIDGITGDELAVDTAFLGAVQGPRGFCDELLPSRAARTDGGLSFFSVDDAVVLHHLGSETPTTPFTSSITSIDTATGTLTLASAPGATWETLAATPGQVLLAFDGHAASELSQRRYCYIADGTTLLIGSTAARRYG